MNRHSVIPIVLVVITLLTMTVFISAHKNIVVKEKPAPDLIPPVPNGILKAIQNQVIAFGTHLKNVTLSSPTVKTQLKNEYSEFISPELLTAWQANPIGAIGRNVSGPWPDRIELVEITKQVGLYKVEANVIEITNADEPLVPAAIYPITIIIKEIDGKLLISSLTKGAHVQLPERISITGIWECLPHTNPNGPQTLECAFGLKDEKTSKHYALNLNLVETAPIDYSVGSHVRVEGVFTPANQLNTDYWQKYPIEGIINVTSVAKSK